MSNTSTPSGRRSALQDWVMELTVMQQSVLISAVRGPDNEAKDSAAKHLVRWYRRCVLISAFDRVVMDDPHQKGGGSFTGPLPPYMETSDAANFYAEMSDSLPHHYQTHMMHAAEILGYKHPVPGIRRFWHEVYCKLVSDLHLNPETEGQMDRRLGDNEHQWRERELLVADTRTGCERA